MAGEASPKEFQAFLDENQYSLNGVRKYERIFGRTYISTGGEDTTEELLSSVGLQPGQKVLDVGCGVGGGIFYMTRKYDVECVGIDLSRNMIRIAQDYAADEFRDCQAEFRLADAMTCELPDEEFDFVYCRDTIIHIKDKLALFKRFLKWLKPGGKLLITDYCCNKGELSTKMNDYIKQRGYTLLTPEQYGKVLEEAGFTNVTVTDRTDDYLDILKREAARVEKVKDDFIKEFSEEDFVSLVGGWRGKIERAEMGDQRWGLFTAVKSSN